MSDEEKLNVIGSTKMGQFLKKIQNFLQRIL